MLILSHVDELVLVAVALRTDQKVHFQENAGLRLFMQDSFTTYEKGGRQKGWRKHLSTQSVPPQPPLAP